MYNFLLWFSDKTYYEMENVTKVEYVNILGQDITVVGDELLTHQYPTSRSLHFLSESKAYTTAGKNIVSIEVSKKT